MGLKFEKFEIIRSGLTIRVLVNVISLYDFCRLRLDIKRHCS